MHFVSASNMQSEEIKSSIEKDRATVKNAGDIDVNDGEQRKHVAEKDHDRMECILSDEDSFRLIVCDKDGCLT